MTADRSLQDGGGRTVLSSSARTQRPMSRASVSGTEGYATEALELLVQYESFTFAEAHASHLHLFPPPPANVLDVGAGTGRDAAGFADLGYHVVAVEPTAELRMPARALHPSPRIKWLDDCLPQLQVLAATAQIFDLVMLTAVWMHLDQAERQIAMPNVAACARPGGRLFLSLRHGPVPAGRRMFEVSASETIALAAASGLLCIHEESGADSKLKRPGVTWDRLVFERNALGKP
ncbi:class I SAM-dependent methyltransferase [Sphingosinicellaceae bacterium]|nr:class I SAM-dependent methyltransferase [Sphingosinicellaceae bacterium]